MAEDRPARVEILLFGGPIVRVGELEIRHFGTRYAASLLALLASQPSRRLRREEIAELLWPTEDPRDTRPRLRQHLFILQKALPSGFLETSHEEIWLACHEELEIDTHRFDTLLLRARRSESDASCIKLFTEAYALYAGPFASDLNVPHLGDLRQHYTQACFEALRSLTGLLAEKEPERALGYAHRAVEQEPKCIAAQEDLVRLLARLRPSQEARRQLRQMEQETGETPSAELRALVQALPLHSSAASTLPGRDRPRVSPGRIRRFSPAWTIAALLLFSAAILVIALLVVPRVWSAHRPPDPDTLVAEISRAHAKGPSAAEREADLCIELGEQAWPHWYTPDQSGWERRLLHVDISLRSSIEWLTEHDPAKAEKLAGALGRYWFIHDRSDRGYRLLSLATGKHADVEPVIHARALLGLSLASLDKGETRVQRGIGYAEESRRIYERVGDLAGEAQALRHEGVLYNDLYRGDVAECLYRSALGLFTRSGSQSGRGHVFLCIAELSNKHGTQDETRLFFGENALRAFDILSVHGDDRAVTEAWNVAALTARGQPHNPTSAAFFQHFADATRVFIERNKIHGDEAHVANGWRHLLITAKKKEDSSTIADAINHVAHHASPTFERDRLYLLGWCIAHASLLSSPATSRNAILTGYISPERNAMSKWLDEGGKMPTSRIVAIALGTRTDETEAD